MRQSDPERRARLSLVIPAYNEEESLSRGVLQQVAECLDNLALDSEVVVVDDGSQDGTADQVERFCQSHPRFQLLRNEHRGKAHTVRTGMLAARGKYRLFMDMDLATSLEHIPQFVEALERGADIAIASRAAKGAVVTGAPRTRYLAGTAFNYLVQLLLLPGISDTQCGFKAFRKEAAEDLFASLVVFEDSDQPLRGPRVTAFDVELLVMARRRGYTIQEIPVRWRHYETKRVNPIKDAYRMFGEVVQVWLNDRRGKYQLTSSLAADPKRTA